MVSERGICEWWPIAEQNFKSRISRVPYISEKAEWLEAQSPERALFDQTLPWNIYIGSIGIVNNSHPERPRAQPVGQQHGAFGITSCETRMTYNILWNVCSTLGFVALRLTGHTFTIHGRVF
jgi:hypothetical protein